MTTVGGALFEICRALLCMFSFQRGRPGALQQVHRWRRLHTPASAPNKLDGTAPVCRTSKTASGTVDFDVNTHSSAFGKAALLASSTTVTEEEPLNATVAELAAHVIHCE